MIKRLRAIVLIIWTLFLVPIIVDFLKRWLAENFTSDPNATLAVLINSAASLVHQLWFQLSLAALTGVVLGAWLDRIARQIDANNDKKLRNLGYLFRSLGDQVLHLQSVRTMSSWPNNVNDIRPEIHSAFLSATKLGVWAPGERVFKCPNYGFLCNYLSFVGKLLEDEHFNEAKAAALSAVTELNKLVPPDS